MVDTQKLKGAIVSAGMTQEDVAECLGMARKTFYQRMRRGIFLSNEIEQMIDILDIQDPLSIFFARK